MLTTYPQTQRGATLIEVLVTLVVLAIGFGAMSGVQTMGINSNEVADCLSLSACLSDKK